MKAIILVEQHAQDIYDYLNDHVESPDVFFPRPQTVQDTRDWIFNLRTGGDYGYALLSEGKVVGVVTLKVIKKRKYQIGFFVKISSRGKTMSAIKEVLTYFPASTIVATPYPDNTRCARFLQKLGFHFSQSKPEYDEWIKET